MTHAPTEDLRRRLDQMGRLTPEAVPRIVEAVLEAARRCGVSDVHLVPTADRLTMSWRIDGALQPAAEFDGALKGNIVARLKVLAGLLTYRTDVPQEGRIADAPADCEMRVGSFPTVFGEKAVVRLSVGSGDFSRLEQLNLDNDVRGVLERSLYETGGLILITGPAGSGKTTTVYACLREIIHTHPVTRSVATLEDPVESIIDGAAQSAVKPSAGFDYETGMKSLLRQDPEVILIGEMRDPGTAAALRSRTNGENPLVRRARIQEYKRRATYFVLFLRYSYAYACRYACDTLAFRVSCRKKTEQRDCTCLLPYAAWLRGASPGLPRLTDGHFAGAVGEWPSRPIRDSMSNVIRYATLPPRQQFAVDRNEEEAAITHAILFMGFFFQA